MGLLDLFGKKGGKLEKHAARVANKRAQAPDRWDAIQALGAMGTPEAVEALLARFTFRVDPSITDQEEKDAAFEGIVAAGEAAVEPVRGYLGKLDSIAWPLKCLERILSDEAVSEELLGLLESMDVEYERDPEKKIQVLAALEERKHPAIIDGVLRFLDDVNEEARFHAVSTLLAQLEGADEDTASRVREALLEAYLREESVRVRSRVLDGFVEQGWDVGDRREEAQAKLPPGYALDGSGKPRRG